MKTLERTHQEVHTPAEVDRRASPGRRNALFVIVAVLALVLGAVGGWMARGSDDGGQVDIVLVGEGELTARQEQMVEVFERGMDAFFDNDGDAVASTWTPNGRLEVLGLEYLMSDGSLIDLANNSSYPALGLLRPVLVRNNQVLAFHTSGGATYIDIATFTSNGEPLLIEQVVTN